MVKNFLGVKQKALQTNLTLTNQLKSNYRLILPFRKEWHQFH